MVGASRNKTRSVMRIPIRRSTLRVSTAWAYEGYPINQRQSECAGTIGSDWWTDIKWYFDNLFVT